MIKINWIPPYKDEVGSVGLMNPYYVDYRLIKVKFPKYYDKNSMITAIIGSNLQDSKPKILNYWEI